MKSLPAGHDLRLPAWGPYTKQYMGISHISDQARGLRFDLSLMPGFYRRKIDIPSVLWESGYHPWEATADYSFFSHRHELEWKDEVYTDISFSRLDDNSRLVRARFVNQTNHAQNLVLHWMASLQPPRLPGHREIHVCAEARLPQGAQWIDSLDYKELTFARSRPSDGLVYDGYLRGETRGQHYTGGSAIGQGFGTDEGDLLLYEVQLNTSLREGTFLLRYQASHNGNLDIRIGQQSYRLNVHKSEELRTSTIHVGEIPAGSFSVELYGTGTGAIIIDGFTLVEQADIEVVSFPDLPWQTEPELLEGPVTGSLILRYDNCPYHYGLMWNFPDVEVRQYKNDELDRYARHTVHNHVDEVLLGNEKGHFTNIFMRPIHLNPNSSITLHGMVCSGSYEEVQAALQQFSLKDEQCEIVYQAARADLNRPSCYPTGDTYLFSQQLMRATLLTNTVFPVYTKRSYIRHNTPGRWWDSLYTWDSGFIGLGLMELDAQRALDCLNAYLTEPGDSQAAFIHHGSPVPVQHYLFLELWNRGQAQAYVHALYPQLRQYYLFLAGKIGGSTTDTSHSGLLKTWDYFYNSGGWDDYPPQKYVHAQSLEHTVAPVITTSQAIRVAKILKMAARMSDAWLKDIPEYEADIRLWSEALEAYAWDEEAGYYSYVVHGEDGQPEGILRHTSGTNYNRGMDGLYPLVAGICTKERAEQLISALFDETRLWTPIGISTVDQSAPYYRADGYWNGAVWMPHQWFFWKTMLDLGHPELAFRIADTALTVWKRETETTYNCYEHFIVQTGRGAGWHHFGGLSAPVLNWFAAYYERGKVSVGFNVWMLEQSFNETLTTYKAEFCYEGATDQPFSLIVNMASGHQYEASSTGCVVNWTMNPCGGLDLVITDCLPQAAIRIQTVDA
ncbi:trehalase family glycosidase [Paenibacillus sp. WQ 127069]|uniref:Trehalase family glycosidase n=1 Tax=Paenibacillus baimaensis TaxID=2982185 RepID=A0ABT2UJX3_9BACL|nr:trehalase family glycosidase [Paenibacillus sp. WQ 127069]MCU6794944.1 trehalase family glycosidase [Paenibacillus sp. WQ 127069]